MSMNLSGSYDPVLVALSIAVATLASLTALSLAGRLLVAERRAQLWWILAASVALGGGIWSMHFVGMLAFVMPTPATFDVQLTLFSLLLPIFLVSAGFVTVGRFGKGFVQLLTAGLLAGFGIVTMHYTGMAAMRIPGVSVTYDPWLVAASVIIALVSATVAFWLAFRTSRTWERLLASVVMGLAISGMHYTAMAAALFTMNNATIAAAALSPEFEPGVLAVAVVSASTILLLLGQVTAFYDRKLSALTASEALALTRSEQRLHALHRNASDIVAILDRQGTFTFEASSARSILGYDTEDLMGKSFADFSPAEQRPDMQSFLDSLLAKPGATVTAEFQIRHADDSFRDFEVIGKNLIDDPAIGGLVVNMSDITQRNLLTAELEKLSETDALTKTLNRRGFLKIAEREFERGRRTGQSLTFVMIDIDHFKGVNDTFGHAAGDLVLAMVAECCRQQIRKTDALCRFGGEEFLMLLNDAALEGAHKTVSRIQADIAAGRVPSIKGDVSVTGSFGIAVVDPRSLDLESAFRLADEALYEAKNSGRDCIRVRA